MTTLAELDRPPTSRPPTARELQVLGLHGVVAGPSHRAILMNAIGQLLGIPPSGFDHGQSRLFQDGDIRLLWLLRRLAARNVADRTASNLARAAQVMTDDIMLTVVTAARENSTSLTAVGPGPVETWHQGGLDFLGAEVPRLGLPKSVTNAWKRRTFISPETGHMVEPAIIPARDQLLAYGAQLGASYANSFRRHLDAILGPAAAGPCVARTSRVARLVWKAYSFLAPGGAAYDAARSIAAQSGRAFGCRSALLFLASRASSTGNELELDDILTVAELNDVEWVRSAKVRTAEALFLERLWTVTRELLPPTAF